MRDARKLERILDQARRASLSEAEAEKVNRTLARHLHHANGGESKLAHRLLSCCSEDPCLSAACSLCSMRLQLRCANKTAELVCSEDVEWNIVELAVGKKVRFERAAAATLIQSRKAELGVVLNRRALTALGALHVLEIDHGSKAWAPHFRAFARLLIQGKAEVLKRRLRHPTVSGPVTIRPFDGNGGSLARLFAPSFDRRQTYRLPRQDAESDNYGTRTLPMRVPQRVTLAEALHQGKPSDRTIKARIARDGRNGALKLID